MPSVEAELVPSFRVISENTTMDSTGEQFMYF